MKVCTFILPSSWCEADSSVQPTIHIVIHYADLLTGAGRPVPKPRVPHFLPPAFSQRSGIDWYNLQTLSNWMATYNYMFVANPREEGGICRNTSGEKISCRTFLPKCAAHLCACAVLCSAVGGVRELWELLTLIMYLKLMH